MPTAQKTKKKKPFQKVKNEFGGWDEQANTTAFEEYVGGVDKAQRLFRLYKDSYPTGNKHDQYYKSKSEVFAIKAIREGFTQQDCDALLSL